MYFILLLIEILNISWQNNAKKDKALSFSSLLSIATDGRI